MKRKMAQEKKKKTVGHISSELAQKAPESGSVVEKAKEMSQDYMKNLLEAVDRGYKDYPNDFYVVVVTKNEKLMPNVFRNYFFNALACPTPTYDQTLFRYNRQAGRIEYIWTIPSKDACIYLLKNAHLVVKEEKQLLEFVQMFADGTLFKMAKKFNNEKDDSPELIKG